MKKFGTVRFNLEQQIKKSGISKSKLCQWAEVQNTQLKNYCLNKTERVDFAVLARLCTVLKCDIGDILTFTPPNQSDTDE